MSIAKGGRAKKAPYSSEMYRIPSPIKPAVMRLAELYRQGLWDGSLESLQIKQKQDSTCSLEQLQSLISAYKSKLNGTEAKAFIEDLQAIVSAQSSMDVNLSDRNLIEK